MHHIHCQCDARAGLGTHRLGELAECKVCHHRHGHNRRHPDASDGEPLAQRATRLAEQIAFEALYGHVEVLGRRCRYALIVRQLAHVVGEIVGPGKALEHHRDDVFVFGQGVGDLAAYPVVGALATVEPVLGEYQHEVAGAVYHVDELLVEFTGVHRLKVEKYAITGRAQLLHYGQGRLVAAVAAVGYKYVVSRCSAAHGVVR